MLIKPELEKGVKALLLKTTIFLSMFYTEKAQCA